MALPISSFHLLSNPANPLSAENFFFMEDESSFLDKTITLKMLSGESNPYVMVHMGMKIPL